MKTDRKNFIFFHGYDELLWHGYEKNGLLNDFTGIRFCQSLLLPEEKKFNNLAAKGGSLSALLSENSFPWYIDRLQGGCFIENYRYDMSLVDSFENFYGFQMHEWVSNMVSDYSKLKNLDTSEWNRESITREIFRLFPFENIFLEAATAEEFAELLPVPTAFEQLADNAKTLFKMRQKYTSGRLLPCDSFIMAPKLEFMYGAERVMPEIGAQTPGTKIQLAYARGMSRAYGKSYGAYYEPWGGEPFSTCNYHLSGENEWNIHSGDFPFESAGCSGGSSRSLQKRIFMYAYLSGAEFISEEWGVYNTFFDCGDFTLSPYGEVKRDFLRFAEKYPAGDFYAPAALVLPSDMLVLPLGNLFGELPYGDCQKQKNHTAACDALAGLMSASCSTFGNETSSLINSDLPDAFDIIHSDNEASFGRYRYLVDLTGDDTFAKTHPNAITADEAKRLLPDCMPVGVTGGVHWFVNKIPDGWYLTIFNNDGIERTVEHGERKIAEASRTAEIDLKGHTSLVPLEGIRDVAVRDGKYYVRIPAGEYLFAKII